MRCIRFSGRSKKKLHTYLCVFLLRNIQNITMGTNYCSVCAKNPNVQLTSVSRMNCYSEHELLSIISFQTLCVKFFFNETARKCANFTFEFDVLCMRVCERNESDQALLNVDLCFHVFTVYLSSTLNLIMFSVFCNFISICIVNNN